MKVFAYVVNRAMKILFWARWCCQNFAVVTCELLWANKAAEPGRRAVYIILMSMELTVFHTFAWTHLGTCCKLGSTCTLVFEKLHALLLQIYKSL